MGVALTYSSSSFLLCLIESMAAWMPCSLSETIVHCVSLHLKASLKRFFIIAFSFPSYCVLLESSELFCLTDFIALAGQASTQALHVLPTHFSLLKFTEKS